MFDIVWATRRIRVAAILFVACIMLFVGGTPAVAGDIGPGIPGDWSISPEELKTVLDTEGYQWKEMKTARDIRISVNYGTAGKRQLKYIFADDILSTVQRNRTGSAFNETDFEELLASWEDEMLEGWDMAEILVHEMMKSEDMQNARQIIFTDGRRYAALSAYRHPNDAVLGNVLYFNPAQTAGSELWRNCMTPGSGFVKKNNVEAP